MTKSEALKKIRGLMAETSKAYKNGLTGDNYQNVAKSLNNAYTKLQLGQISADDALSAISQAEAILSAFKPTGKKDGKKDGGKSGGGNNTKEARNKAYEDISRELKALLDSKAISKDDYFKALNKAFLDSSSNAIIGRSAKDYVEIKRTGGGKTGGQSGGGEDSGGGMTEEQYEAARKEKYKEYKAGKITRYAYDQWRKANKPGGNGPVGGSGGTGGGGGTPADVETDRILKATEEQLRAVYGRAASELSKKLSDFSEKKEQKAAELHEQLQRGEITEDEYMDKMNALIFRTKQWADKVDQATGTLADANTQALQIINKEKMGVFAENANYQAYQLTKDAGMALNFSIYDMDAVERLMREEPELLPRKKLDRHKDEAWNRRQIAGALAQGIIQGESIPQLAKRISMDTASANGSAMVRYARTAMTGAQNAGRMETLHRGQKLGIKCKKCWLATLDSRTRDSHQQMDGVMVDVDEDFKTPLGSKMQFPGDTAGKPGDVWNCRCTMTYEYEGYEGQGEQRIAYEEGIDENGKPYRRSVLIKNMTYQEWKQWKTGGGTQGQKKTDGVVNGKDISGTWKRRKDEFNSAIEDVINAQGFDGNPRLVGKEEFDRLVQESSFIAQRSYSAPDQATLDSYRDQLYHGGPKNWYVDCGTGGAQYGQGMYCAADYTGTLTDGIKAEMSHYKGLYTMDLRNESIPVDTRLQLAEKYAKENGITDEKELRYINAWLTKDKQLVKELGLSEESREKMNDLLRYANILQPSYTETMTLDPSARIIKYDDLVALSQQPGAWDIMSNGETTDLGVFAAQLGYDAINAEGHGESGSYTVILNRTKCIILDESADKRKEEEEKKRAEEEARRKAEEEAKRKAEEEARKKAEEEARKKAEEEARRKAEEEAKRKAEEERRKAEEAAKQSKETKIKDIMTSGSAKGMSAAQKKEFQGVLDGMTDENLDLYSRMSENHKRNIYKDPDPKTGYYMPSTKKVQMNLDDTMWEQRMGRKDKAAWKVKFHEELHQLDHILGRMNGGGTYGEFTRAKGHGATEEGKKMAAAIEKDLLNFINGAIREENESRAKYGMKTMKEVTSLTKDFQQQQSKTIFSKLWSDTVKVSSTSAETKKNRAAISAFTDALGLATEGRLDPHPEGYWGHKHDYNERNKMNGATSELFAEIGSHIMRGDQEALDAISVYMPNTVKAYQDVFHMLATNGQKLHY